VICLSVGFAILIVVSVQLDVRPFASGAIELRNGWANRVIDRLSKRLPDLRLLVCLDAVDAEGLVPDRDMRGFFQPVDRHYYRSRIWPTYLATKLKTINRSGFEATYNYDCIVYLPNRTCEREDSLTMTLAHELIHFIQFGSDWRIWAWNTVIANLNRETIREMQLTWKDIPIEWEARLFAKRIAEELVGSGRTAEYIEFRITENVTERDVADWKFVKALNPHNASNTGEMTKALFNRLADIRSELERTLDGMRIRFPDFCRLDLNEMLPATAGNMF
jgi:hypothetical protein